MLQVVPLRSGLCITDAEDESQQQSHLSLQQGCIWQAYSLVSTASCETHTTRTEASEKLPVAVKHVPPEKKELLQSLLPWLRSCLVL